MKYFLLFFFFSFPSLLLSVDDFHVCSVRQTFEEKNSKKNNENVIGVSDYRGIIFGNKFVSLL